MKLLLFSDVHTNRRHCERLVELSADADLVVGAGDFGSMRMGIKKTINWLKDIDKPTVVVPGNAESYHELQDACAKWSNAKVLHGTGIEVEGIPFFGLGGGVPITPFGPWSYDFSEEQARELLKNCPKHVVLVSHSPPYGVLDVSSRGQHLGSRAVQQVIEEKSPQLVVCGHIHESAGKMERFAFTDVINAGPQGMWYQWKRDRISK